MKSSWRTRHIRQQLQIWASSHGQRMSVLVIFQLSRQDSPPVDRPSVESGTAYGSPKYSQVLDKSRNEPIIARYRYINAVVIEMFNKIQWTTLWCSSVGYVRGGHRTESHHRIYFTGDDPIGSHPTGGNPIGGCPTRGYPHRNYRTVGRPNGGYPHVDYFRETITKGTAVVWLTVIEQGFWPVDLGVGSRMWCRASASDAIKI